MRKNDNETMISQRLSPQCFLLPCLRESKSTRIDARIGREKLSEVLWQCIGWFDDVHPIAYDGQNKVGALGSYRWLGYEGVTRTAWHQRTNAQRPVPETCMVSTNVADIHHCVKPGGEYRVTNAKSSSYITLGMTGLQVLIENRHRTKRSNFQRYPTGGKRVAIFPFERPDVLFVAALKLILDTGKRFSMLGLAGKKTGIAEPIAAMSMRHDVGHLRANSYFNTLNRREYDATQLTVKLIQHLRLFKSTAMLEDMVLPVGKKRIPIAAHAVVTDFMEPLFCIVFISNQQSTLLQDANLVGKRLNLLGVWCSVHCHITKKAHPKRAVLREAG